MPNSKLSQKFLLPELKLVDVFRTSRRGYQIIAHKESKMEICPKCASQSTKVHDRRWIKVKDAPHRGKIFFLKILKRRFRCPNCKSVFTESVPGIKKHARITQRFEKSLLWACENFQDLKRVRKAHDCGYKLIYKSYYKQLERKFKEREKDCWPKTIGIDEHGFSKDKKRGARNFATLVVDYDNKRVKEVIQGKSHQKLFEGLDYIKGRERVRNVVIDLADSYKSFVKKFFPNARIIADKFHVLRLINPTLTKKRVGITGDKRTHQLKNLLLRNRPKLHFEDRIELDHWLNQYPELKEVYWAKEKLHKLYRCKGFNKAKASLIKFIEWLDKSKIKELQRLKRTLLRWSKEILHYFSMRITNARTEAFNNSAKLIQKRAYGFKSFGNYRLRVLNACS
jgi:transposase